MPTMKTSFGRLDGRYLNLVGGTPEGALTTVVLANSAETVADGTTSIDVADSSEFRINNTGATTITAFTNMVDGQYVNLNFVDNGLTILEHNALIRLTDRRNFRSYAGARISLWYDETDGYFRQVH